MVKRINSVNPLMVVYAIAILVLAFTAFSAVTSASVIWQAESALGHPLSCNDAYEYRAIDSYFYPDHRLQGDVLYFYSLFSPLLLLGFMGLTVVVGNKLFPLQSALHLKKPLLALIGIGVTVFFILLAYGPVIYTIACATE